MPRLLSLLAVLAGLFAVAAPEPKEPRWATVRGQVVWPGKAAVPKPDAIDVTTDKAVCCADGPLLSNQLLVDPKTRGVANVVVWLRPDTDDRKVTFPLDRIHPDLAKPKPAKHVVTMPRCQFEPRVLAARAGDRVEFRNTATIPHNLNVATGEPEFGQTVPTGELLHAMDPLAAQATPIAFKCDVHPWMAGRIRVFDHPYFAVTDKDGKFEMKHVPKGSWRVVYWHELGFHKGRDGALGYKVAVVGDTKLDAVELALPKR